MTLNTSLIRSAIAIVAATAQMTPATTASGQDSGAAAGGTVTAEELCRLTIGATQAAAEGRLAALPDGEVINAILDLVLSREGCAEMPGARHSLIAYLLERLQQFDVWPTETVGPATLERVRAVLLDLAKSETPAIRILIVGAISELDLPSPSTFAPALTELIASADTSVASAACAVASNLIAKGKLIEASLAPEAGIEFRLALTQVLETSWEQQRAQIEVDQDEVLDDRRAGMLRTLWAIARAEAQSATLLLDGLVFEQRDLEEAGLGRKAVFCDGLLRAIVRSTTLLREQGPRRAPSDLVLQNEEKSDFVVGVAAEVVGSRVLSDYERQRAALLLRWIHDADATTEVRAAMIRSTCGRLHGEVTNTLLQQILSFGL